MRVIGSDPAASEHFLESKFDSAVNFPPSSKHSFVYLDSLELGHRDGMNALKDN